MFFSVKTYSQSMSFSQAYQQMNSENSSLKASQKMQESQSFKEKAVKGLRYPSVKAFGMGVWFDRSLGIDLNGLRNGLADFVQIPNPNELGDWKMDFNKRAMVFGGVSLEMPLFTGGKINAAIEAERLRSQIAATEFDNVQSALVTQLAERYFMVKLTQEAVIVREKVLKAMQKHLADATKLEEHGMIAPVEKLGAQVAVSEANRELEAIKKDAVLARIALANTLEMDDVPVHLSSEFFLVDNLEDIEYYRSAAVDNYPLLQKIELEKQLAHQGVKVAKSDRLPSVAAFGQTILTHNNPISGLDILYNNNKPWVVGVGVSYSIFEGFKTKNEIKAAKATLETVEYLQDQAISEVKMLVAKLYQDLQKQQEQIANLNVQLELATEFVRVRNRAFSEGFASSSEVVDAEVALSVVELLRLEAHFQYAVELAGLLEVSGMSRNFLEYTN